MEVEALKEIWLVLVGQVEGSQTEKTAVSEGTEVLKVFVGLGILGEETIAIQKKKKNTNTAAWKFGEQPNCEPDRSLRRKVKLSKKLRMRNVNL